MPGKMQKIERPGGKEIRPLRDDLLETAAKNFVSRLPEEDFPRQEQLRAAANDVELLFKETLITEEWLDRVVEQRDKINERLGLLKLNFSEWIEDHPLPVPPPTLVETLEGWKLAVATVLGTFLGGLLFSGLFNLLMDKPDFGFVIGALLGSGGMTIAMWQAAENKKIRRMLQGLLGVASVAEILVLFGKISGFGALWSVLRAQIGRGFFNFFKRVFLYFLVIIILKLSVKKPVFDRRAYQQNLKLTFELWVENALTFLHAEIRRGHPPDKKEGLPAQAILKEIGRCIHKIHRSPPEILPDAASELLLKARSLGFEGLEEEPNFIRAMDNYSKEILWESSLEEKFDTVGIVEEGDTVSIEQRPVIQDGIVLEKGLVRKVRKTS